MAWTPSKTWTSELLTRSDLNTYLRDNMEYLKGVADGVTASGVQIRRSTAQTIATSTEENISFAVESFDFGGWWSTGTTVTVPAGAIPAGFTSILVDIYAAMTWETDGTGKRRLRVLKNGSSIGGWKVTALDDDVTDIVFADAVEVEAGDTLRLEAWQNSGGGLDVTEARFTVLRRAPAS